MSVDKVQSKFLTADEYKGLTEEQKTQYALATSKKEKKQLTIQFRTEAAKAAEQKQPVVLTGAVVEEGDKTVLSPEQQEARVKAHNDAVADLARIKNMSRADRELADQAVTDSGKDKALWRNKKARKELRGTLEDDIKTRLLKANPEMDEKKAEKLAKRFAKAEAHRIAVQDRIEHTEVYETKKEKRAAKKDSDDKNVRFTSLKKKMRSENNDAIKSTMDARGVKAGEAAYLIQDGHSGVDNTYQPEEIQGLTNEFGTNKADKTTRKTVKALGYDVDDDTMKNVGKALAAAGIGTAASIPLKEAVNIVATAFAHAAVVDGDGNVLKEESASAESTETFSNNRAILGGAVGAATATVLAAALFGSTKDEDILRGTGIEHVFKDNADTGKRAYETMTFGNKKDTENVKMVLAEIDKLDFTDEQKTQLLKDAAGSNTNYRLSKEELMAAYVNALRTEKAEEKPPVEQPVEQPVEPPKPEYKTEVQQLGKHGHDEPIQTGLPHKSGLYADIIVRQGYTRADGKAFTEKQIKEIRNKVQKDNKVNENKKVPATWMLDNEITLSDGTVVKLKSKDELSKIEPPKGQKNNGFGVNKNQNTPKTQYVYEYTEHGYTVSKKGPGETEFTVVDRKNGFHSAQEAQAAANAKKAELEKADENK